MSQYFENGDFYNHDGAYSFERRESSEWWSPGTGAPMTRGPSGESIATSGGDQVQTPTSEYGAYNSSWPMPVENYDCLWPPSDFSHDITFSPTSFTISHIPDVEYTAGNGDDYNAGDPDAYWGYGYITPVDSGQQASWRSRPDLGPMDQGLATRAAEDTAPTNEGLFVCKERGCKGRFRRKADWIRHIEQRHTPADKKPKYPCDWKKCQRSKEPFYRRDHQRDHLRDFHAEDLTRRGSSAKQDEEWWNSRIVNPTWWRCARCLTRVKVEEYGYTCSECGTSCEAERQNYRSRKAELHGPA
ncbi:hypothetical protein F5Y10DRAFT_214483 [Nemania abortiva]|nr:hypothetical protein F5Y10DRAFT_214483 [Nemania abortiva]